MWPSLNLPSIKVMVVFISVLALVIIVSLRLLSFSAGKPARIGYVGDYEEVCGWSWQEVYIHLHHSIMSGKRHGKYIVAIPVKAGLADVLHGYISAFLWALISERAFLVERVDRLDDDTQRTIEFAYHPLYINWTSPSLHRDIYECLLPPYDGGCSNPPSVGHATFNGKEAVSFRQVEGVNGGFTEEFDKVDLIDKYHEDDILLTASNRGTTYRIFDNPYHQHYLKNVLKLTPQTAFPCLFHLLFQMNKDVCDESCMQVARKLQHAGQNPKFIRIAMHVRDPDLRHGGTNAPEHFYCADSLIEHYKQQGLRVVLVLVTASATLQSHARHKYGDILLLPSGEPKQVEVVHDRPGKRRTREETEELDRRGVMDSARDFYILSLTDIQILSPRSGFGVVGSMMALKKKHIMYHLKLKGEKRQCAMKPEGDELSVFADEWSGI